MSRTILVPLDGSAFAERALRLAGSLAARGGCRLVLVRAALAHRLFGEHDVEAERQVVQCAEEYLATVAERLDEAQYVERHVFYGSPAEGILEEVRLCDADLLVMATHGRAGADRWLFGSVADEVLRHATVPVVLVPAACARTWEPDRPLRLVVPLDGSRFALEALGAIPRLARLAAGAPFEIALLQVVEPIRLPSYAQPAPQLAVDPESDLAGARRYLDAIADSWRPFAREVTVHAAIGSPGEKIATLAGDLDADLVIMATHGHGGLRRLILGSTAAETLHQARTPLLLVRPVGMRQTVGESGADRVGVEPGSEPATTEAAATSVAASDAQRLLDQAVASAKARPPAVSGDALAAAAAGAGIAQDRLPSSAADEFDAKTIVLATHGRTGFSLALHGSVASEVVQGTNRPVLLVRPQPAT